MSIILTKAAEVFLIFTTHYIHAYAIVMQLLNTPSDQYVRDDRREGSKEREAQETSRPIASWEREGHTGL